MSDHPYPPILIYAAAGTPHTTDLVERLAHHGFEGIVVTQASQGFMHLSKSSSSDFPIRMVIGLSPVPGMTMAIFTRSIRSMPNCGQLPFLLVSSDTLSLPHCHILPPPIDLDAIIHLAIQDPEHWPTASTPVVTSPPPITQTNVILVVDDHEVNQRLISAQIQGLGLPIETCADGAAAVARVQAGGVALVLMDCQMPVMDGYTATRAIRVAEQGTHKHLPIIAVTAHVMNENRQQCLDAGMDDFLSKPVDHDQLLNTIRHWLNMPQPIAHSVSDIKPVVFSPQTLRSIHQSAPDTCRRILTVISEELATAQLALPQLVAYDDLLQLSKAAHKLKGATISVGALEVSHLCSALEVAARSDQRDESARLVTNIQEAIVRLLPHLAGFENS